MISSVNVIKFRFIDDYLKLNNDIKMISGIPLHTMRFGVEMLLKLQCIYETKKIIMFLVT